MRRLVVGTGPFFGVVLFIVYILRQRVHVVVQIATFRLGQTAIGSICTLLLSNFAALLIEFFGLRTRQFARLHAVPDAVRLMVLTMIYVVLAMLPLGMGGVRAAFGKDRQSGDRQATGQGKTDNKGFFHDGLLE